VKRIGIIAAGVITGLLAVVLVAPSFIDWTDYRDTFESRLATLTGRSVSLEGDVSLALLPRPSLQVAGVQIGSVAGASHSEFVRADAVAVNLAFGPLLSGRLQFTSIEIINPIVNAEVLADGRTTWSLSAASQQDQFSLSEDGGGVVLDLGIDSLTLIDGTVIYRDATAGTEFVLSGLNADVRAESVSGPYVVVGGLTALDLPWNFDVAVGALPDDQARSVIAKIVSEDAGIAVDISGQFSLGGAVLRGGGRMSVSGDSAALSFKALGLVPDKINLPTPVNSAFSVQGKVTLEGKAVDVADLQVLFGRATTEGTAALSFGDEAWFDLDLRLGRLDLNSWFEGALGSLEKHASVRRLIGTPAAHAQEEVNRQPSNLSANLSGNVNLKVDLIEWRGQVIRNGVVSVSLANSELTLADVGAQLPGNTTFNVSGFIRAEQGQPVFDLVTAASSRNLRGFLDWIDFEPSSSLVPPSRLNALALTSNVSGTIDKLTFDEIDLTLDTTRLTGAMVYWPGTESRINLDFELSRLDLDSYLPALSERLAVLRSGVNAENGGADATWSPTSDFASVLSGIETQVDMSVGSVIIAGNVLRDVRLSAASERGAISVTTFSVDDFVGARLSASGSVSNLEGTAKVDTLVMELEAQEFLRVGRSLDLNLPQLPLLSGPLSIKLQLSGTLQNLSGTADARLSNLALSAVGNVSAKYPDLSMVAKVNLSHPMYPDLIASLGYDLPDSPVSVAAVAASSDIASMAQVFTLTNVVLRAGENNLTAELSVDLSEPRPSVTGLVSIGALNLDGLYPTDPITELTQSSRSRSTSGSGAVSGRWPSQQIDLSAMQTFDASIDLTGKKIAGRGLVIEELAAQIRLAEGKLVVAGWKGQIFGGPATGDIAVSFDTKLDFQTRFDIQDALIERMGSGSESSASGKVSLQGNFATIGANQRDWVSALSGNGAFEATGLDANGVVGQAPFLLAAWSPARALSQLGGLLGGGVTKGFASMSANFTGDAGVFVLSDATVRSNVYSGDFAGAIDLPRLWIEVDGGIRLGADIITQLPENRLQMPYTIPVNINGPLSAPNVRMDAYGGATSLAPLSETVPEQGL
jgi:uncharacterized protein involved in outer membrane biogenesis